MIHKAKKSLGQNFLKSKSALQMMCTVGEVNNKDIILEIGPGKGALTKKLLDKSKKVIAVEKDNNLFIFLQDKFKKEIKENKIELINEDILNLDLEKINLKDKNYKLIANIPYNITGLIFKKFLSTNIQPEKMLLLVQKEVAERIVGKNKESILSISVKIYGKPKYIMKVSKRFFSPMPKVDSAIIAITDISKDIFKNSKEEEQFFEIVKSGFLHKRKLLKNNLEMAGFNKEKIENLFKILKIDQKSRAEDLRKEDWVKIQSEINKKS